MPYRPNLTLKLIQDIKKKNLNRVFILKQQTKINETGGLTQVNIKITDFRVESVFQILSLD